MKHQCFNEPLFFPSTNAPVCCQDTTIDLWVTPAFTNLPSLGICSAFFCIGSMHLLENWTLFAALKLKPAHTFSPSGRQIQSRAGDIHDDHILQQDQVSTAAVMVLGERSILVISGSGSLAWCTIRPAPRDQERETIKEQYDWEQERSWGWILPEIGCPFFKEAKLMDRQFFLFFWIGDNWEPTGKGTWILWAGWPLFKLDILSVWRAWTVTHLWEDGGRSRG